MTPQLRNAVLVKIRLLLRLLPRFNYPEFVVL
jgi:hypothetical protein